MQESLAAMQTAVRVLAAITKRCAPDPKDVEALHKLAPLAPDQPPDELACEVIRLALQHRRKARAATQG